MSTEQNKDKSPNGIKKAPPSRFDEARKRAEKLTAATPAGPAENPVTEFFKGAWSELKKTTWPTKEILTKSVSVVLLLVFAVAVWVLAVDLLSNRLLNPIFGTSPN